MTRPHQLQHSFFLLLMKMIESEFGQILTQLIFSDQWRGSELVICSRVNQNYYTTVPEHDSLILITRLLFSTLYCSSLFKKLFCHTPDSGHQFDMKISIMVQSSSVNIERMSPSRISGGVQHFLRMF